MRGFQRRPSPCKANQGRAVGSPNPVWEPPAGGRVVFAAVRTSARTRGPGRGGRLKRLLLAGRLLLAALLFLAPARAPAGTEAADVTLEYVAKKAEDRARKPFHSPKEDLPEALRPDKLDYDKYRIIQFRHDQALWKAEKLPFTIEFFHPGYLYQELVRINEFAPGFAQPIRFVQDFFDYGKLQIQNQIPVNTGYAGFRVLNALNDPSKMDEIGSFLGASYFRLLGKGQRYGESARGLSLDSGESDRPEEFPLFTDWWLGKPKPGDQALQLFAILDSVSCAGAFEFRIRPGETTAADIDAVVFFRPSELVKEADPKRKPVKTIGLAPLTSMFWFGGNSERKFDDFRPGVHDSDGLLVRLGTGETLWRPLNNPAAMRHQVFPASNVRGFGLLQRDRDFHDYQDIVNPYELTPSVWVEPRGNWGEGDLHLLELSTTYEGLDNVAAFWDPKNKPAPMEPFRFGYTLLWTREKEIKLSPDKTVSTRIGAVPGHAGQRQIVIDFGGPKLDKLQNGIVPLVVAGCGPNGKILGSQVYKFPFNNTWRVVLQMEPAAGDKDPVALRCLLKNGEEVLTETWTYHWSPP